MPHDWPALPDLLTTVVEFLEQLGPRLEGQDRYHALCSVYLLNIAQRELAQWQAVDDEDLARLAGLIKDHPTASDADAVTQLCQAIRAGRFDQNLDELLPILHQHVVAKVRVSRPDHLEPEDRA